MTAASQEIFDHQLLQTSIAAMAANNLSDTTVVAPEGGIWRIIDLADSRSAEWMEKAVNEVSIVNLIDSGRPDATCLFPATDPARPELFILVPAALDKDDFDTVLSMLLGWAGVIAERHSQNGGVSIVSYGGKATRIEPIAGTQLRARLAGVPIDGKLTPTASPDEWQGRILPALRNVCDCRVVATEETVHRWHKPLSFIQVPSLTVFSTTEGEKAWQDYFDGPDVPITPVDLTPCRAIPDRCRGATAAQAMSDEGKSIE